MIDHGNIAAVLLPDGWHRVKRGTFTIARSWPTGGMDAGFTFERLTDDGIPDGEVNGPLTSVVAVSSS